MKILMVTMSMNIGGAETHILELCRELKSLGHDITLASFGGVYAEQIVECGIRHVKLPLHSKNPVSVLRSYNRLKELISKEKYDIVHAHARIPAFICGLLHDRMTFGDGVKFRFVTTAHLNFTTNALLRRISRWGERVMAVSDDITDYLVDEYGYPRDKIHVTINGIDTEKFSPSTDSSGIVNAHSLDKSHRRIVYMSRLDEDRADPAFRLVNIAPKIAEKYPDCDIIIVGGGNVYDKIKEKADEVNRSVGRELVTMTGAVSNTSEYCAAATVFIGVSRSALEAMASEKPVIIAGNQGSLGIFYKCKIKPAIDTNFCCRGFDVADEDALFADISALLDKSDDELGEMGRYNRAFILENYTARRMANDYMKMYEKTLSMPLPINPKRAHPDIVMSGYYGFHNLGDESLLDIITQSLAEEIPDVKIAALTKSPRADTRRTGLGCVSRYNYFALRSLIKKSGMLISGGGSLLQDKTSKRSLGYYAGIIKTAEKVGTKVTVLSNGIGPISHEENKKKTRDVIDHAQYVSVRDSESKAELIRLGVRNGERINVSADPAFLIRPADDHALSRLFSKIGLGERRFFAVSVRPLTSLKKNGMISEADAESVEQIAAVCAEIAGKDGIVPVIIPMQCSQDEKLCRMLCDSLRGAGTEAFMLIPDSAAELIGVLGRAELVIGMRLHSIIFASSAGCPVIGLSYDPKVRGMMEELGQRYCIDLTNGGEYAGILAEYAEDVLENREKIGDELRKTAEEMRKKCSRDMMEIREMIR